ncbi:MAG: ABC transporter permease/substrate-binding protein [Cyanobium sp. LacPavin_0818_WC50_MAG_67_9]|nr:ABC transporter permease/substrate-binding protein [Cyanobium sp. LacPavin_0818_WC50_MAG_67_9]
MPSELPRRLVEHLGLVGLALAIGLLLALPLGVILARRPRLAELLLAGASVLQTIPSLALFGLLLTVPLLGGIGPAPAVVALSLYALLPLLRTTVTGLKGVPAGLVEAGLVLGLSRRQIFRSIEVPLAWPVILTGIRLATVSSVGLATVAAAIGAGGLGVFIFRGIATVDHGLILAGAVPAAGLALLLDWVLGHVPAWSGRFRIPRRALLALGGLACTAVLMWPHHPRGVITIGSKNFTEQVILPF